MANQDTSFGLRPIGLNGASANTTGVTQYEIATNNTNAIFQNSPVIPLSTGFIDIVGNANGGTVPALGVFLGVEYVDSSSKKTVFKNYWPGSNNVSVDTNFPVKALVADNPNQLFMVAADETVTDRATAIADNPNARIFLMLLVILLTPFLPVMGKPQIGLEPTTYGLQNRCSAN